MAKYCSMVGSSYGDEWITWTPHPGPRVVGAGSSPLFDLLVETAGGRISGHVVQLTERMQREIARQHSCEDSIHVHTRADQMIKAIMRTVACGYLRNTIWQHCIVTYMYMHSHVRCWPTRTCTGYMYYTYLYPRDIEESTESRTLNPRLEHFQ